MFWAMPGAVLQRRSAVLSDARALPPKWERFILKPCRGIMEEAGMILKLQSRKTLKRA